jgi:serine O-acetyltransferase
MKKRLDSFFNQSDRAVRAIYRMLNHSKHHRRILARLYNVHIYKRYGMQIHPRCEIGRNLYLPHPLGIVIGKGVVVGDDVEILHNVTLGIKDGKFPKIESGAVLYSGSVIVGDIVVGAGAIIAPNSVIISDVERESVYSGNPGKRIDKKEGA